MSIVSHRRGLSMAAATALVLCGTNLMDPYLCAVRGWASWVIVIAGFVGLILCCRSSSRSKLLVLSWMAVPLAVGAVWSGHALDRFEVLSAGDGDIALLGRHFVVGYDRAEEVEPLVAGGYVAGVVVNRRNVTHRNIAQVHDEIARLRALRREAGLPGLLVAADQEGGAVSHLSPMLATMPPLSTLTTLSDMAAAAHDYGVAQGRGLADLGINVDFSPVLDIRPDGRPVIDTNTHIRERAISADPDIVGTIGLAYAQGLAEAGVTATAKHFPGLGRTHVDTHHFQGLVKADKSELEGADWRPFRRVLGGSNAILMLGHVVVQAIDPDNPASHSKRVVDALRREWGYRGVLITDDLVMGAIYHHGFCKAVVDSLNAGVDLLLIAYDGQQYYRAMSCALDALHKGEIDLPGLAASAIRLDASPFAKMRGGA